MIVGRLEDWRRYFAGGAWEKAFTHALSVRAEAPEETIELMGPDMTARVMSYDTINREAGKLEAHRDHVDIQIPLVNDERIDWFPLEGLAPKDAYDQAKDVIHYVPPQMVIGSVCVGPGLFAVMFPEDAHMPKLVTTEPHRMKKIVIKMHVRLLGRGAGG